MASAPISTGSASVDNFYVRSFAGKSTFLKPLGGVNSGDLASAKVILSYFEVVLILEHLDRDLVQVQKLLGWHTAVLGRAKSTDKKKVSFSPAQELFLRKRNALDYDFFEHANNVAERITGRARAN
jgi:hypothetical protein